MGMLPGTESRADLLFKSADGKKDIRGCDIEAHWRFRS
jgi:hypothetical protein